MAQSITVRVGMAVLGGPAFNATNEELAEYLVEKASDECQSVDAAVYLLAAQRLTMPKGLAELEAVANRLGKADAK